MEDSRAVSGLGQTPGAAVPGSPAACQGARLARAGLSRTGTDGQRRSPAVDAAGLELAAPSLGHPRPRSGMRRCRAAVPRGSPPRSRPEALRPPARPPSATVASAGFLGRSPGVAGIRHFPALATRRPARRGGGPDHVRRGVRASAAASWRGLSRRPPPFRPPAWFAPEGAGLAEGLGQPEPGSAELTPAAGRYWGAARAPWEKRGCSPTIMLEDAWCNPYSRTRRTGVQLVLLSGDARVQHPLMPGNIGVQPLSFTQGYRGAAPLPLVDSGVHSPTVPS